MHTFTFRSLLSILILLFLHTEILPQENQIITDFLKLRTSFGDKNIPEEFLLAEPQGLTIMPNGNILVCDECRLKVFDKNGNPVRIVGEKGQGPGEFETVGNPLLTSDGLLSVFASYSYYNIFDTELNYLYRLNPQLENRYKGVFKKFFRLTPKIQYLYTYINSERIILFDSMGHKKYQYTIVHETADNIKVIHSANANVYITDERGKLTYVPRQGNLLMELLPDRRIVYIHTGNDKELDDGDYYYKLTISTYNGESKTTIKNKYNPIEFSDDFIDARTEMSSVVGNFLRKFPYYPTLQEIKVDGNTIFAFTFTTNKNEEILTDIFDAVTGNYLRSAYFPFIPYLIKDGVAYHQKAPITVPAGMKIPDELKKGNMFFPVIEIYEVDQRIYNK